MSRSFVGAAGNRLVATEMGGDGLPVLLMHGGGQTRHAWAKTAHRLARAGFHAVALDQRGHGDSDWVEDGDYTFPQFGADAAAVAREIVAERGAKPIAIGASLGGLAALLAQTEPDEPFQGIVLVDIVPRMDWGGIDRIQGFMRTHAEDGFATIEEAGDAVAAYLPHRPRPASLEGLKKNLRLHSDGRWRWHWDPRFLDGERNVNLDRPGSEEAFVAAARQLKVPVLLVRGGSSEIVGAESVREFLADVPRAEFVDVAQARHMVAGDRNDVFADAILDFLTRRFPQDGATAAAGQARMAAAR